MIILVKAGSDEGWVFTAVNDMIKYMMQSFQTQGAAHAD